ncbi:MAG: radical SAM family heme chaperone HemW [Synergistaceae bacterium]|jgi:oxygen-independent coproporphyrinogen-3 oxidase|nr:radical SAM family heme chaperone HemW [Synergistaceae bacterium]
MTFALYVHVPFCVAKCDYCAFYSRVFDEALCDEWLTGMSREAERLATVWKGKIPLRTTYVGGGTPSVPPLSAWERLFKILGKAFDFSRVKEFTVEANPCSLTSDHLRLWREFRVTRISLGAQSLNDGELAWLGRRHDAGMALMALKKILFFDFDASIDLIFGLPDQTLRTWRQSLHTALAVGVGHVSVYQLTLEPGTPLSYTSPSLPEGYPFYRFAQWYLPRKGLAQYEIASFARSGKECRHNLAYWRQENVLALGPSAWGYLSLQQQGFRYQNAPTLEEYSASESIVEVERLKGRSRGVESAILALRTRWGIDVEYFATRFGQKLADEILDLLKEAPPRLTRFEGKSVALTPAGMRVGNAIWAKLLELEE